MREIRLSGLEAGGTGNRFSVCLLINLALYSIRDTPFSPGR